MELSGVSTRPAPVEGRTPLNRFGRAYSAAPFLAILAAAIVIAIVAAIGFAIYRGNRDEAELERKSRELLCQWDGGTGPNCDALR